MTVLFDARGRRRSPATLPGGRRRVVPKGAGVVAGAGGPGGG
jgi:hypothetical protein